MKSTGIVRKMDQLGRIVVPMELRRTLGIVEQDSIEIFVDNNEQIILRKFISKGCAFCGESRNIIKFKRKYVCQTCVDEIHSDFLS